MKNKALLYISALGLIHNAHANLATPCSGYGVSSLKVVGLTEFSNIPADQDICLNPEQFQLYPALAEIVNHATKTMNDVSSTVGLPSNVLYPSGIMITIKQGDLGPLDEAASGNELYLYEFSDWAGGGFDESGFTHELGHVIATTLPPSSPIIDLGSLPFLREGFPDLLAYVVTGKTFNHDNDLPAIINQAADRSLDETYSYQGTALFFLENYAYIQLERACLATSSDESKNPHVQQLCSLLEKQIQSKEYQITLAHGSDPFSAQGCYQFWDPAWSAWGCDTHQLSLPWTSGIVALGKDRALAFVKALINPNDPIPPRSYSCHYANDLDASHAIQIFKKHWRDIWSQFYASLDKKTQATWNQIFSRNRLEMSESFGDFWLQSKVAVQHAQAEIASRQRSGSDPVYNQMNPCWHYGSYGDPAHPECNVVCR